MISSILPRLSPARLTTLSPITAEVERTLGWVSTVVLDMLSPSRGRSSKPRSVNPVQAGVFRAGDNHAGRKRLQNLCRHISAWHSQGGSAELPTGCRNLPTSHGKLGYAIRAFGRLG